MNRMKAKKAQEEIVGFVAIVLIISIILVIFLAIILRQDEPQAQKSEEIYQFLESIMEYTTSCAINYEPNYISLGQLMQECNEGISLCTNSKSPCILAKETITEILNASFRASEDSSIKGYEFLFLYLSDTDKREIINVTKGKCSQSAKGAEILSPSSPGTLSSSLKICY